MKPASRINYKIIVIMILLFLVLLFTLQNTEPVSLSFFFWKFTLSRALMFFLIFAVGVLLGYVLALARQTRGARRR